MTYFASKRKNERIFDRVRKTVFRKVSVCLLSGDRINFERIIGLDRDLVHFFKAMDRSDHLIKLYINSFMWGNFLHSHYMRRYWFYVINDFQDFHQIFTFWNPLSQKKTVFTKVSVVCVQFLWTLGHFLRRCIFYLIWKTLILILKKTIENQKFHFSTKICEIRNKRWNSKSFAWIKSTIVFPY